jgi:hypothetical protein
MDSITVNKEELKQLIDAETDTVILAQVNELLSKEKSLHPVLLKLLDQSAASKNATPHTTVKDFIRRK